MKSLKIGSIKLKNRLFLAPMVDVSDLPYRLLCRKEGAAIAYTEMLNIGSILHSNNQKTKNIMKTSVLDKPVGIQVTGRTLKEFEDVSKINQMKKFDLIDVNCGCPSIRITGNQSGSYLLKHPEKIGDMIKILKNAGFLVTAKIRLGFKNNNVLRVSKQIEKAGAELLTIHARLAFEGASVPPDLKWISKVKKEIGIPVIGNGGVKSGEDAKKMLEICDGVMVASGAIGNPAVFREILYYLRTGKEKKVDSKERVNLFSEYINLAEKHGVLEIPRVKFLGGWFLRGFDGAAKSRAEFMGLKKIGEIRDFLGKI